MERSRIEHWIDDMQRANAAMLEACRKSEARMIANYIDYLKAKNQPEVTK